MDRLRSKSRLGAVCLVHESLTKLCFIVVLAILLLGLPQGGQPVSLVSPTSNPLKEYVIYSSVEGPTRDTDNERIRLHLGMVLAPAHVQEFGGDYTGIEFWRVMMSDTQRAAFVGANPTVSGGAARGDLL